MNEYKKRQGTTHAILGLLVRVGRAVALVRGGVASCRFLLLYRPRRPFFQSTDILFLEVPLMALMPDKSDPNYKQQMERFKQHPEEWNRPGLVANVPAPVRPANYVPAPLKQNPGRHEAVERIRRKLLTHHGVNPNDLGSGDRAATIAEMLFVLAGEREDAVNYDHPSARNMLRSAGLLRDKESKP